MGHWVGRFVSLSVGWLVELAANVIPLFDDVFYFFFSSNLHYQFQVSHVLVSYSLFFKRNRKHFPGVPISYRNTRESFGEREIVSYSQRSPLRLMDENGGLQ